MGMLLMEFKSLFLPRLICKKQLHLILEFLRNIKNSLLEMVKKINLA
jgi:hypothetical protein